MELERFTAVDLFYNWLFIEIVASVFRSLFFYLIFFFFYLIFFFFGKWPIAGRFMDAGVAAIMTRKSKRKHYSTLRDIAAHSLTQTHTQTHLHTHNII